MDAAKQARLLIALLLTLVLSGCRVSLPKDSPELMDWEEPAEWMHPAQDEDQRKSLPAGCFSGLQFSAAARSLEGDEPQGLEISGVVENSPAAAAGLRAGDQLLEARVGEVRTMLDAPSDWRELELGSAAGTRVDLQLERGSRSLETSLVLVSRVEPALRSEPVRARESLRAGILVREASEAQSRAAGLPPGAGVILIGMSRSSPWRRSPLRFGDLLITVNDERIDQPSKLMRVIREAGPDQTLRIGYQREGTRAVAEVQLTERQRGLREFGIPLLFSWSQSTQRTQWSMLLSLLDYESNPSAWQFRLLWLIRFRGGDSERLEEIR